MNTIRHLGPSNRQRSDTSPQTILRSLSTTLRSTLFALYGCFSLWSTFDVDHPHVASPLGPSLVSSPVILCRYPLPCHAIPTETSRDALERGFNAAHGEVMPRLVRPSTAITASAAHPGRARQHGLMPPGPASRWLSPVSNSDQQHDTGHRSRIWSELLVLVRLLGNGTDGA
ncbi:hypothetical protein C8035_v007405 [Colletotrichum spinosum]|uniref:Uncharacterized protein n=1 Tax=Colletotrichum spinosum TaxID=1347390 RepID=A0A4V3HQP5_9PEZI|nr:hypothetical protein C8035_v007405 [Colletotrichum spinosum]